MRIRELEPGQKPTKRQYNELVKSLKSISKIKGRNGMRVLNGATGKNLIGGGQAEAVALPGGVLVWGVTFDEAIRGEWEIESGQSPSAWSMSFAINQTSGHSPSQFDAIRWNFYLKAGTYRIAAAFGIDPSFGNLHWFVNEVEVGEFDGSGATSQFGYDVTSNFEVAEGWATVDCSIDSRDFPNDWFCHLGWVNIRSTG